MNNQRWLSISFFTFFFTWGVFVPYWIGWLTNEKGLSVKDASIVMGAGMIARSFSTFFVFPYLTERTSYIRVIKWTTVVSLVLAILYIPDSSFIGLFVITVLFSAVYPIILPAVESGASVLMQKERVHYGKSRSYGSIGYTIALLLVGAATAIWNEQAILYMMIAGLAIAAVFYSRPAPAVLQSMPERKGSKKLNYWIKDVICSKRFSCCDDTCHLVARRPRILLQLRLSVSR